MLYIAAVFPTGQIGLVAVASLFVAAAVIESGPGSGISVFIVSSALGILLVANKTPPILYILFFGYYPIVKILAERLSRNSLQWLIKLINFNASLTIAFFILRELFIQFTSRSFGVILLYIAGNAVFILFDFGYSKLILYYKERIQKTRS